ncbi:MAG: hypothetical protein HGB26_01430 [Desulfobulbaceae bacterium]|nr:hypothetical protein [Desulfobulbaceae bacterium]
MTDHAADLQAVYTAAKEAATATPSTANIQALEKARKALEEYTAAQDGAGERYKTQAAALEYLQRRYQIQKSKLSKDVIDGKVPRKDGYYHARDLDYYANAVRLDLKTSAPVVATSDLSDEVKRETARKLRISNEEREGLLIRKDEEEARDAKLWAAIKADIYNNAAAIVHELINLALPVITSDDERARLLARTHDLRTAYEDMIDDMFDRYADIEDEA